MGMITKCYPGNDGVVRVVDVKTMYGEYKRPVVKLMKIDVTKLGIEQSFNTAGEKMYRQFNKRTKNAFLI
jgi:hypothetical protein